MTTAGDIIYASGANTPARLAKSTTSTQYLANTGTSNVPAWNEVALATGVSGTLPVGNGGIGATTLTANGALIGNGTSAITSVDMSTKGGLLAGDGSGNPSVLAVGGTDDHVLTVDSGETTGMKWGAAPTGALSFEGSQATEATTSSDSAVDLLTLASISITAATPFEFSVLARKTGGEVSAAGLGLKLNTTSTGEADASNTHVAIWRSGHANEEISSGAAKCFIGPRITNYLRGGTSYYSAAGQNLDRGDAGRPCKTADMPTATITQVVIRGLCDGTGITLGADELMCYERAYS